MSTISLRFFDLYLLRRNVLRTKAHPANLPPEFHRNREIHLHQNQVAIIIPNDLQQISRGNLSGIMSPFEEIYGRFFT